MTRLITQIALDHIGKSHCAIGIDLGARNVTTNLPSDRNNRTCSASALRTLSALGLMSSMLEDISAQSRWIGRRFDTNLRRRPKINYFRIYARYANFNFFKMLGTRKSPGAARDVFDTRIYAEMPSVRVSKTALWAQGWDPVIPELSTLVIFQA